MAEADAMLRRMGAGLVVALVAAAIIFLVGMRTKSPAVVDLVRRVNRAVFNPHQMKTAGAPGAYASVIRHRGRTTGRAYETPVQAVPTGDGFVISLPYGLRADWLQNVIAAGSASILHESRIYEIARPEIIPVEAAAASFSPQERRSLRLFGVDQCLRVRLAEADTVSPP